MRKENDKGVCMHKISKEYLFSEKVNISSPINIPLLAIKKQIINKRYFHV